MQSKRENEVFDFGYAEPKPILSKDSARRMQSKRENEVFDFGYAEPRPIFHRYKGKEAEHIKKREKTAFWHYL